MKRTGGFTLAELMLVVVLLGLTVGATMTVLARQQQFYRSAGQLSEVRTQLRQAIGAIPTDLRAVSPSGNDFYALSDKAVEFRAVTGSAIICRIASATQFLIPPLQLANGNTLTVWSTAPISSVMSRVRVWAMLRLLAVRRYLRKPLASQEIS